MGCRNQIQRCVFYVFPIFLSLFPMVIGTAAADSLKLNIDPVFVGFSNIAISFNNRSMSVDAGEFQAKYTGSYTSELLPAFCVDLTKLIHYGENNIDDILSPESYTPNGIYVEWLVDYALSPLMRPENKGKSSAGAGLQLAIWKVLYDFDLSATQSNYNLTDENGIFSYDTSTTTDFTDDWYNGYINRFIDEIENGFYYTSTGQYTVLQLSTDSRNSQDIITEIPEPATVMFLLAGFLGLSLMRRKRR